MKKDRLYFKMKKKRFKLSKLTKKRLVKKERKIRKRNKRKRKLKNPIDQKLKVKLALIKKEVKKKYYMKNFCIKNNFIRIVTCFMVFLTLECLPDCDWDKFIIIIL